MERYLLVKVQPGAQNVNKVRNRISIMTGVSEVLLLQSKFKKEDVGTVEEGLFFRPDKEILMDIIDLFVPIVELIPLRDVEEKRAIEGKIEEVKKKILKGGG